MSTTLKAELISGIAFVVVCSFIIGVSERTGTHHVPFISPPPNDIPMAKYKCPYCGSEFDTAEELSKHIDRVHHGSGLLEGDTRKY